MKQVVLALGLILAFYSVPNAQNVSADSVSKAKKSASITNNGSENAIAAGTHFSAELQKSLNVEKAKVGDQVLLKTTKSVKQNGEVIVEKGSTLIGRITEVQKRTKGNADSKISVLFDTLQKGKTTVPITASIVSITNAGSRTVVNDSVFADTAARSTASGRTSSGGRSSGGLLGGVIDTVGGVSNTATSAAGGVAGGVVQTAGSAIGSVGGASRGLAISQSTDASASGGSTLSFSGGNLNLEKGTTFVLAVSSSTSAKSDSKTPERKSN
jgi:hypothetical protein